MASSTPSSGSIFGAPASTTSSTQNLQPPMTQSVFGTVAATQSGQTIFGQPAPVVAAAPPFGQPASTSSSSTAAVASNPFAKPSDSSGSGVAVGMFGKKIEEFCVMQSD